MNTIYEKAKVGQIVTFTDNETIKYQANYRGNKMWDLYKLIANYKKIFLAALNCDEYSSPYDIYHFYTTEKEYMT